MEYMLILPRYDTLSIFHSFIVFLSLAKIFHEQCRVVCLAIV